MKLSYLVAGIGVLIAALASVRIGALVIAVALGIFVAPQFSRQRPLERVISLTFVIALIVVSLALPR